VLGKKFANGPAAGGVLAVVSARLSEAMGPMAPFVLDEHVRALGESPESFPPARLEELVERLSKEILTDSFRQQFEQEVMREIRRSGEHHV
jgi:hypothetical protein